jgi:hypothetical protein
VEEELLCLLCDSIYVLWSGSVVDPVPEDLDPLDEKVDGVVPRMQLWSWIAQGPEVEGIAREPTRLFQKSLTVAVEALQEVVS